VRWRLSLMMFVLYTVPGSFAPLFSLRLKHLGFTDNWIGLTSATQSLASLVGPLVAGQVADRWVSAERCLTVCALASAGLLWTLADLHEPWPVFVVALAAWLFVAPTMTLGTAVSFHHMASPEKDFGPVRLWGTVGWVAPNLFLGLWFANPGWRPAFLSGGELADCFRLGALCAVVLAGYGLTLPRSTRRHPATSWLAPLAALKLLRDRSFAVFVAGSMGLCLTLALATQGMPLLFEKLEVPLAWIAPTQTISQSTELIMLFCLPMLLLRLGMRGTMLMGLVAWLAGMIVFGIGGPLPLVIPFLGSWGVMVCGYLVAGQVFVNSRARGDIRASAQGLLTCLNAIGQLAGNLLAGWIRAFSGGELGPMFGVAAARVAVLGVVFVVGFRPERQGPLAA
jgi:MFS family permease